MSIRVSILSEAQRTVFKVDGRLRSEDVEELARALRPVHGATVLDLSELQSADRAGVEILREMISLGAEVRNASRYIELLLNGTT